jgi:Na+-transporting NADH:ubiquinone oxidoreductase subunit C
MIYNVYQDNKLDRVIFPVEGKGLWSTMKGFLALSKDKQTIEGLTFYSHGETPGLGGEIDNPDWKKQWVGKKAFDNATNIGGSIDVVKVKVLKGKVKSPQTADDCVNGDKKDGCYQVDGLSGATLTSNGVNYLVQFWLSDMGYGNYIKKMAN